MKRALKWVLIIGGGLVGLVIVALLLVPMFVDVDSYKPMIEEKVSEATGRPFRLAGDLDLSLFPWAGFGLSDLHLGNPPGFEREDFLYVRSIDVRVKLLPLLSRDLQVKRFILEGVQVNLEKAEDGRTNWEDLGGAPKEAGKKPAEQTPPESGKEISTSELPLQALAVGDFSVSGALLWIDHAAGTRKEISDLSLKLQNVSLDQPIDMIFALKLDGNPLRLEGAIGPLSKDPMTASIPMDLQLTALDRLNMHIKGSIESLASTRRYDMGIQIAPFSPRELLQAFGGQTAPATADPDVLKRASLEVRAAGTPTEVSLKEGLVQLDQSNVKFSAQAEQFHRPSLAFDLELDKINIDRYLPPPGKEEGDQDKGTEKPKTGKKAEPIDYEPLRKLILDGTVRVGTLEAKGLRIQDILLEVSAKDGVIRMDPLEAKLYQGTIRADAQADVRGKTPKSRFSTRLKGIQAGPLVRSLADKDIIEGTVQGDVALDTVGDRPDPIKQNLNGRGELLFQNGAIVGVDLAAMARNAQAAFGLAEKQQTGDRPKTDFSELSAPFTIKEGVVNTPGTQLKSPFLRLVATGTADLVDEILDFRVEPKVVATMKGQGDTKERSGIRVPILVTGPFSSPKFRPDLKGVIEENLKGKVPDASQLKKMLQPGSDQGEEQTDSPKDQVKDLLKGFGVGQ